jgi:putative ABC transport system permease protein
MTPLGLAWSNLAHKRTRTAIAAAGVAFAVILTFMELGLLGGVGRTATMLYDALNFDLLITSREYVDLSRPDDFPRSRLAQARSVSGVAAVDPLSVGVGQWRLPARRELFGRMSEPGGNMSINLIAAPPDRLNQVFAVEQGKVFRSKAEADAAGVQIARLDTFLIDRKSLPAFGTYEELRAIPPDGAPVPGGRPGDVNAVRLNGNRAEVVGEFELGSGFSWRGMLLCSEETFSRSLMRPADRVTFGLVHLTPGANPVEVRQHLRAALPSDVLVFTRDEINESERRYWLKLTSVGQFLYVAVVLAVVVGIIFVYQMMAADIRNMLSEYATVKALGYQPGYLTGVVLWQAVLLALLGFVPGFLVALGLYAAARTWGGIPVMMTAPVAAEVLALTCGMCLISGVLAVRKVHSAQPADLF